MYKIRLTTAAFRALQKKEIDLFKGTGDLVNFDTQAEIIYEGTRHLENPPSREEVEQAHGNMTPGEALALIRGGIEESMGVKPEAAGGTVAETKSAAPPAEEGGGDPE